MTTLALEVKEEEEALEESSPRTASQLPEPKGYKLLIAVPEIDETTDGGIINFRQRNQDLVAFWLR